VTPEQWRLVRRAETVLQQETGCRDDELAGLLEVAVVDLRPVLGAMYRMRRVDRCWAWTVAPPARRAA
jgi:hypothetical protein